MTSCVENTIISVERTVGSGLVGVKFRGSLDHEVWPEFKQKCLCLNAPVKVVLDLRDIEHIGVLGIFRLKQT